MERWAVATIIVEKLRKDYDPKSAGPMLFTVLDGEADEALSHTEVEELAVDNGEKILFDIVDAIKVRI